ncbi:MAG: GNAT family N-acetyltransferase, partial [Candidatus Aenigmatarchaeota archaeon]
MKEFNIFYLVGRRKENIVAIIPFFTMDFSLTTLIRGRIQKIIFFIRKFLKKILKIRILFIGAPITEELYIGVSKEENLENIFDAALNKIEEFCKKEKIKIIAFYNLSKKHIALIDYLKRKKFVEMENFPNTLIEIKTNSLENYIKNLSRGTRKDIKRKIKKVSKLVKLETVLYTKIDHIIDEIYKLYLNNKNASDLQFENLTPEFFINISKNMPQETKWFITKEKGEIVAFNLCFVKNNFCIDKFIGLDYSVAFKYNLYFMTFLNNID